MLESLNALPKVPAEAGRAYVAQAPAMVERVNRALAEACRDRDLLGGAALKVMADNHRHHAAFMGNVFMLGRNGMLAKIVPWVYRAYRNLGFRPDYFTTAYPAWIAAMESELEPEHSRALAPVYHWLIENHPRFLSLASEPLIPTGAAEPAWTERRERFQEAILEGRAQEALALALVEPDEEGAVRDFFQQVIQPSMYEVGTRWEEGRLSVAREHLAFAIVARALAVKHSRMTVTSEPRGLAVVTAVDNEYHELGAWMVATVLELADWEVHYLGANTPTESLVELIAELRPSFVALSITMPFNLTEVGKIMGRIRSDPGLAETRVIVGGLVFHYMPEIQECLGADAYGANCGEIVDIVEDWR